MMEWSLIYCWMYFLFKFIFIFFVNIVIWWRRKKIRDRVCFEVNIIHSRVTVESSRNMYKHNVGLWWFELLVERNESLFFQYKILKEEKSGLTSILFDVKCCSRMKLKAISKSVTEHVFLTVSDWICSNCYLYK
jgi:hypothetical protein